MNAALALGGLRGLGVPVFTTADASVTLKQSLGAASKTLQRLRAAGLVWSIRKGLWTVHDDLSPFVLPEHLTSPQPSYVSLQTALHLHGMIDQIPSVVYAVSLARTQRIQTSRGAFSIHRIGPSFFGGFDVSPQSGAKIATPEKALLDVFYLSAGRSRLFSSLPEVEIPAGFRMSQVRAWIARIPSPRLRTIVNGRLSTLMPSVRP